MLRSLTTKDSEGRVGRRAFAQDYGEPEGLVGFASVEECLLEEGQKIKGGRSGVGRMQLRDYTYRRRESRERSSGGY